MTKVRTEEEVDILIEEMLKKNKGKYITQGVAFNRDSPSQMKLLKMALMSSYSFGGFVKELITEKFSESETKVQQVPFKQFENVSNNDLKEFKTPEPIEPPIIQNNFKEFESPKPATSNKSVQNWV